MFKKIEKISAVALGAMCLAKGLTFGLALVLLIEFYTRNKTAKSGK